MYDNAVELLRAIGAGEDSFLEFKELIFEGRKMVAAGEGQAPSWLARQVCAFANSDGGVLVLGVADSSAIVGVEPDRIDEVLQFVINVGRENVEPPLDHLLLIDSVQLPVGIGTKLVVKVEIRPDFYAVHAPRGGRPTIRSGNTTREVSMEALPRLLARRGSITPVDERPVLSATVDDLDRDGIAAYHQARFGRPADDVDRLMRNLKLVVDDDVSGSHPTVAGLLVFGRNPQAHIGGARIDIAAYNSDVPDTDRRLDSRSFGGRVTAKS
jgi:predicted HTH transcriptional regulator